MLIAKEPISRSRRCFFSFNTTPASQRRGKRRIGLGLRPFGAQQYRFAAPHLHQAHFVNRNRRIGLGGPGIADQHNLLFGVGADQKPGRTIVEQQDDGAVAADGEQMPPAQPQRARPHASVLCPGGQGGGGRNGVARPHAEFVRIQGPARNSGPTSSSPAAWGGLVRVRRHHPPSTCRHPRSHRLGRRPGRRSRARGCCPMARVCVRQIYPRANPFRGVSDNCATPRCPVSAAPGQVDNTDARSFASKETLSSQGGLIDRRSAVAIISVTTRSRFRVCRKRGPKPTYILISRSDQHRLRIKFAYRLKFQSHTIVHRSPPCRTGQAPVQTTNRYSCLDSIPVVTLPVSAYCDTAMKT